MPAGNFEENLRLPASGSGVLAEGPLQGLNDGDVVKTLYAWIVQLKPDGTCAASTGEKEASDTEALPLDRWDVPTELEGAPTAVDFAPGPAFAFAMGIFQVLETDEAGQADRKQKVFWWGQNVTLAREDKARGSAGEGG
jgi:hypothetical protein